MSEPSWSPARGRLELRRRPPRARAGAWFLLSLFLGTPPTPAADPRAGPSDPPPPPPPEAAAPAKLPSPVTASPGTGAPDTGQAPQPQAEAISLKREALAAAASVAEAYPDDALSHALLGSACFNTGQSVPAMQHLNRCLALNPAQTDAYEVLARMAYEKGEPEEAVRVGREALKHQAVTPEILNQLGKALLDLGRTDEAIQALRQAVSLPGAPVETHYLLGQSFLQAGDPAQAKASFQRVIERAPDHTQAFFGLFTACQRLEQADEAHRYREQFQHLEATDRRALTDRNSSEDTLTGLPLVRQTVARTIFGAAQIHRLHGRPNEAATLFRRAAELDAESPIYRAALEALYVQTKAPQAGIAAFEQLTREQPGCGLNHFFLGRLQARLQQFDAAERSYRRVQELSPAWAPGYRALAELYLRTERQPAEALAMARKATDLEPSGPHFQLLAVAAVKTGDRAGALAAMRQAVGLVPGDAKYQAFLQQLEKAP